MDVPWTPARAGHFGDEWTGCRARGLGLRFRAALAGKVERFFGTFKGWARRKLWAWFATRAAVARSMQRRLAVFRDRYNERPRQGLGGLTPNQAWNGVKRLKTKTIRAHEPQPGFTLTRRRYGGDSHLAVVDVAIDWPEAA